MIEAMREGYRLLRTAGIPVMPEGADTALDRRGKRATARLTLWVMAKTTLGRLAASDH